MIAQAAATAGAPAGGALAINRTMITVSVMAASIMQSLDTTIATVALPHMQGSLSGTQDQMVWVLTSYIVAAAIMTPLAGWLAGRLGRKRIFFFSVIGFTIASVLCGAAESLAQIVAFRALQGLCGAALIPLSQAILLDINPKERHGRAMALWGMGVVLGPIIGPLLGGWLTENYSWRWVFYVNVPFGILAALGIAAFLPETATRRSRFDLFGFAMLSLGIGALQIMLDRGELKDWFASPEIQIEGLIALLAIFLFIVHMWTAEHPFINRALFGDRNFTIGNAFIAIVAIVLFATMAILPPMLQVLLGYPVLTAGIITAPRGLGTWISMAVVGRLTGRLDARWIIGIGLGLCVIALAQMAYLSPDTGQQPLVISGMLQGFGTGFAYVAISTLAFATLSPALRDEGAAFFNLTRNIASSVGISSIQAYISSRTHVMHAQLVELVTPYNLAARQPEWSAQLATPGGLSRLSDMISNQASWIAYLDSFHLMMWLTLLAIPLLVCVRGAKAKSNGRSVVSE